MDLPKADRFSLLVRHRDNKGPEVEEPPAQAFSQGSPELTPGNLQGNSAFSRLADCLSVL